MVALAIGVVAGLRTMTAPAALWLARGPSPAAGVLALMALAEYAGDLYPRAPARTAPGPLLGRIVSGAYCGWSVTKNTATPGVVGAVLGITGALAGAYAGLALRQRAMARIGAVPAALAEDLVAAAGALLILRRPR